VGLLASSFFFFLSIQDRPLIHRSLHHSEWRKNVPDMGGHTLQSCSFYYSHRSIKIEKKISLSVEEKQKKKGECMDDERPRLVCQTSQSDVYHHEGNKDVQLQQCYLSFP
jgi:hypothetical protein